MMSLVRCSTNVPHNEDQTQKQVRAAQKAGQILGTAVTQKAIESVRRTLQTLYHHLQMLDYLFHRGTLFID